MYGFDSINFHLYVLEFNYHMLSVFTLMYGIEWVLQLNNYCAADASLYVYSSKCMRHAYMYILVRFGESPGW